MFWATSVTRRRYAAYTTNSSGIRTRGAAVDTTIGADVQPLNGKEIALLPEGARASDSRKAYTATELRTEDQHLGLPADEVVIGGVTFKVLKVEQQIAVIPHYRATLIRIGEAV